MTEHYGFNDDLILPFIFVPHGEGETPELQEFKARYPGWFTIPAEFTPHDGPGSSESAVPTVVDAERWPEPDRFQAPHPGWAAPARLGDSNPALSARAFQRAYEVHGDAVQALRALRDRTDAFADDAPESTRATPAKDPASTNPELIEVNRFTSDPSDAARGLGMSPMNFRKAIHSLKDGLGLRGDDDLLFHIPSGDVFFNGENVGNLHDE
ncbi:MAG: hypothetical protein WBQ75_07375 [Acetobacteraceae bacterium]